MHDGNKVLSTHAVPNDATAKTNDNQKLKGSSRILMFASQRVALRLTLPRVKGCFPTYAPMSQLMLESRGRALPYDAGARA